MCARACVCVSVAVPAGEQKGLGHKSHIIHHTLALREGWKRGGAGWMACLGPHLPPETRRLTPVCVVPAIICGCVRVKKSVSVHRLGGPVNKEGLNHPFAFSSSLFSLRLTLFLSFSRTSYRETVPKPLRSWAGNHV